MPLHRESMHMGQDRGTTALSGEAILWANCRCAGGAGDGSSVRRGVGKGVGEKGYTLDFLNKNCTMWLVMCEVPWGCGTFPASPQLPLSVCQWHWQ